LMREGWRNEGSSYGIERENAKGDGGSVAVRTTGTVGTEEGTCKSLGGFKIIRGRRREIRRGRITKEEEEKNKTSGPLRSYEGRQKRQRRSVETERNKAHSGRKG
jgi:hypothetical protein